MDFKIALNVFLNNTLPLEYLLKSNGWIIEFEKELLSRVEVRQLIHFKIKNYYQLIRNQWNKVSVSQEQKP